MIQIVPNYVIQIATQLKWAWDCLLHDSFFHHRASPAVIRLPEYVDQLCIRRFEESEEPVECVVCLCKIDGGDEVRELRCGHLFHRVCLDRWMGNGHATCPLCRNNLKPPRFAAELHQELIVIDFFASCGSHDGDDRCNWWLR